MVAGLKYVDAVNNGSVVGGQPGVALGLLPSGVKSEVR
jgi:hypothetical protein